MFFQPPVVEPGLRWERRAEGWQPIAEEAVEQDVPPTRMEGDDAVFETESGFPVAVTSDEFPRFLEQDLHVPEFVWEQDDLGLSAVTLKRSDELALSEVRSKENWSKFKASVVKEWSSILSTGAVTILTKQRSDEARRLYPTRIMPSRHVFRWKPGEGVNTPPSAKRRWSVLGHRDPDIMKLARSSPTPQPRPSISFFGLILVLSVRCAWVMSGQPSCSQTSKLGSARTGHCLPRSLLTASFLRTARC